METLGTLIDKLTIVNIKCYHMIDLHMDESKSKDERFEASIKVRELNSQRNELIEEIDQFLDDAIKGKVKINRKIIKNYKGGGKG